jgi:hypothetical protein
MSFSVGGLEYCDMAPELREGYGQDKMQPEQMQEREGEEREKERKA